MATVLTDQAALRRLLHGRQGPVARDLARRAIRVEVAAKQLMTTERHVDTGRARASISWRLGEDSLGLYAQIGSVVPYFRGLELGNRPHVIVPRSKQALFWKGAPHPVRRVQHPGNRGYHILRRALRAAL